MTLIFNQQTYGTLLAKYQPKVIETEEENERAIILAQELEHKENRSREEEALLELLLTLIEKFEETYYPIPESYPHKILQHLLEENNLKQEDLVKIIGSSDMISVIINGKQNISEAQAKALADFFKVDKKLFI